MALAAPVLYPLVYPDERGSILRACDGPLNGPVPDIFTREPSNDSVMLRSKAGAGLNVMQHTEHSSPTRTHPAMPGFKDPPAPVGR